MFINHFKMTAQPFLERSPVEAILKDERISQGLARLEYLAAQGTIALVTGQSGIGKSALIKLFVHSLPQNRFRPVYVHLTRMKATSLLRLIVEKLGETPKRGKERLFTQILDKATGTERTTILIIDECHLIDPEALTDLRLLVSSALDNTAPLKILLVGQQPLREQLRRACHGDLLNRISVRYILRPMTKTQTLSYIDFQLTNVGASEKIFDTPVKDLIHDHAQGIPRLINNIATACLINAAAHNAQIVNEPILSDTITEFQS